MGRGELQASYQSAHTLRHQTFTGAAMTMNHPDITLYGTDPAAHRRRMVRDLELFLASALGADQGEPTLPLPVIRERAGVRVQPRESAEDPHPNPLPEYRAREQEPLYSTATATVEDPRC